MSDVLPAQSAVSGPGQDARTLQTILIRDSGTTRIIELNRPERRNAIDLQMRVELFDAIEAASADPTIVALVITGVGPSFCTGGDVASMQRQAPEVSRPRAEAAQRVTRALWFSPKPVVAAVEGHAIGAGLSLALACDRIVAADGARFGAGFGRVGLAGDMGIFASLPARVGPARARQILMFDERLDAPTALKLGLADALVATGGALERALSDARAVADAAPQAVAATKAILRNWPMEAEAILRHEVDTQVRLWDTDDFEEAVAAFADKRAPHFRRTAR